jgi:hypothetical protein
VSERILLLLRLPSPLRRGVGDEVMIKKEPPMVRAALRTYSVIYFTLTAAILTENNPLIIRTARTTTIRERLNKDGFMGCRFRPIIGGNGNKSRARCRNRISKIAP